MLGVTKKEKKKKKKKKKDWSWSILVVGLEGQGRTERGRDIKSLTAPFPLSSMYTFLLWRPQYLPLCKFKTLYSSFHFIAFLPQLILVHNIDVKLKHNADSKLFEKTVMTKHPQDIHVSR